MFNKIKKILKDQKGTTLFEALTGIAILLIMSFMILGGFVTAQRLMVYGDDYQTKTNANYENAELKKNATGTSFETTVTLSGVTSFTGKFRTYDASADEKSTLVEFYNEFPYSAS